jgi:hypothetical protein
MYLHTRSGTTATAGTIWQTPRIMQGVEMGTSMICSARMAMIRKLTWSVYVPPSSSRDQIRKGTTMKKVSLYASEGGRFAV